jgi:hypothetical protein
VQDKHGGTCCGSRAETDRCAGRARAHPMRAKCGSPRGSSPCPPPRPSPAPLRTWHVIFLARLPHPRIRRPLFVIDLVAPRPRNCPFFFKHSDHSRDTPRSNDPVKGFMSRYFIGDAENARDARNGVPLERNEILFARPGILFDNRAKSRLGKSRRYRRIHTRARARAHTHTCVCAQIISENCRDADIRSRSSSYLLPITSIL